MKQLLAIVAAFLVLVAIADPPTFGRVLDVAVAAAWAKQDRGRDREDRGSDGNRGRGNDDKERGRDQHRDQDRGRGRGNDRQERDQDSDRGPPQAREHSEDRGLVEDRGSPDDRGPPEDRGLDDDRDRDRDLSEFASRFDLEDDETFDHDGFLARRGEIIAMSTDAALPRRAAALGLQVVEQDALASLHSTVYRLSVPAASAIDGILARLRAQDPAGVFDRNHLYERSAASSLTTASIKTGLRPQALISAADGITIGLIDTSVDVLHPALHGTHIELRYFVDESRALPEAHGTAVTSLLVSPEFGLLPGAQLYIACAFFEDRRGASLSEAGDLVHALDWLMERRVPVINMSFSGPPNAVLRAAIARAIAAGHLIVAAVGNAGPAAPPLYPAAYDGVIGVTAVDVGQRVFRRANRGAQVELAAVGVGVLAAAPGGLAPYSGTSFATPYVAALAAMDYRTLDARLALSVKESLRKNALDLGKPGRDDIYGFGLARPRTVISASAR